MAGDLDLLPLSLSRANSVPQVFPYPVPTVVPLWFLLTGTWNVAEALARRCLRLGDSHGLGFRVSSDRRQVVISAQTGPEAPLPPPPRG